MFPDEALFNALNVPTVTVLLDTVAGVIGIFSGSIIPQWFTSDKVINFYMTGQYSGGNENEEFLYTINCRAKTFAESQAIAQAVFFVLNRRNIGNMYFVCDILRTIPPENDADTFNTPIEILIKKRGA